MGKLIKKDEVANYVGYEAEPTPWHTTTQEQINEFADCTQDHQFIHIDPERAKETPFGTTIAHGFLTLSMLSKFAESFGIGIEGAYMGVNYGFDKVRFMAPVKVNSRVRANTKILAIEERKPGQFAVTTEVSVEIEGEEKSALLAHWITVQFVA